MGKKLDHLYLYRCPEKSISSSWSWSIKELKCDNKSPINLTDNGEVLTQLLDVWMNQLKPFTG